MIKLKQLLVEGRYDNITTQLSRQIVNAIKSNQAQGEIDFEFPATKPISIDGLADLEFTPEIKLIYTIKYSKRFKMNFDIYGQADDETIELAITVNPNALPDLYSEIVPIIKDAIRHEIEHVAQNLLNRPESERFEKIPQDDFFAYLTAKHEVPAFVRGLYKQAKTRRVPMYQMIDKFLQDYAHRLTSDEQSRVKIIWTDYARKHLPKAQL